MTKEIILKYFYYDREHGQLIWKYHEDPGTRTRLVNSVAGSVILNKNKTPYRYVVFAGNQAYVHVLIFIIENGYRPKQVDHIDGNGLNNKIENLRACVSQNANQRNRPSHRGGRLPGAYFCKCTNRWRARVRINNKTKCLGRHDTEMQAHHVATEYLNNKGLL